MKRAVFSPGEKLLFYNKAQYSGTARQLLWATGAPFKGAGSRELKTISFGTSWPFLTWMTCSAC